MAQGSVRRPSSSYIPRASHASKAIKASFKANRVVAKAHSNKGKSNKKDKLTLKQIQDVQFIMNYGGGYT